MTLFHTLTYDPLFNRSKRADQTSRVSKATSASPPPSIVQSPMSKPRSRRSSLVYAVMFSSRWSTRKVAGKWRLDCCGRATTVEKCVSFRLRLRDILLVYQAFRELTPVFVAAVTGRYFEVLHLRIGAAGCQQCAR